MLFRLAEKSVSGAGRSAKPARHGLAALALGAIVAISAPQSSAQMPGPQTAQGAPPVSGAMEAFKPAEPPRELPEIRFADAQGQPMDLATYRGQLVLINFWATWCAPCVAEMPSLDRLQAALGKDGLAVLPLSLDGPTRAKVAPFYEERKLANLPILFDEKMQTFSRFGISVLPTTILVGRDGREVGRLVGAAEWDSPEAIALLKHYLAAGG